MFRIEKADEQKTPEGRRLTAEVELIRVNQLI
jgi:hypothetical protein